MTNYCTCDRRTTARRKERKKMQLVSPIDLSSVMQCKQTKKETEHCRKQTKFNASIQLLWCGRRKKMLKLQVKPHRTKATTARVKMLQGVPKPILGQPNQFHKSITVLAAYGIQHLAAQHPNLRILFDVAASSSSSSSSSRLEIECFCSGVTE